VATSWNLGIKATPFAPWWLVANFDITWPPGALERMCQAASRDTVTLSAGHPPWCAFALGDTVVERIGLFDEALHPAYMEDSDYERRCLAAAIPVVRTDITVTHDNSSTLLAGYQDKNAHTFGDNLTYYQAKKDAEDMSEGAWSLKRRRELSWD
jgi:GT2 family glycosyltransferase